MDSNISIQQSRIPNQPFLKQSDISHQTKKFPKTILISGLIGIVLLVGIGGYVLGARSAKFATNIVPVSPASSPSPSPLLSPLPTSDITISWETYFGNTFSVKYPTSWITKKSPSAAIDHVEIYDPNEMHKDITNGGYTIYLPIKYVNIIVDESTETPKQYVDRITSGPPYSNFQINRKTIFINEQPAEMYAESGAGSRGYDIVFSNGKLLVIINIPTEDIDADQTISKILSTFKFTQ